MPSYEEEEFECCCCGEMNDTDSLNRYEGEALCDSCYSNRRDEESSYDSNIADHDYRPTAIWHNDSGRTSSQQITINSVPLLYFGIEIETESGSGWGPHEGADHVISNCGRLVYCKHDGSLDHGFEIVTHPMSYGYVQNHLGGLWGSLRTLREYGFRAWSTSTCGLHIHISRNAFINDRHTQKFMWFIYGGDPKHMTRQQMTIQNQHTEAMKKFAGRDSHWSKFDRENFVGTVYDGDDQDGNSQYVYPTLMEIAKGVTKKGNSVSQMGGDRYLALNRNNRHTLELRFFRPSMRPDTILASIEFVQCLFDYTEQITARQIIQHNGLASFQMLGEYAKSNKDKYPAFIARAIKRGVFVDPTVSTDDSVDGEE